MSNRVKGLLQRGALKIAFQQKDTLGAFFPSPACTVALHRQNSHTAKITEELIISSIYW